MADDQTRWHSVSALPQEAEMHIPNHQELLDVVWLSGSAIAVAPRTNPPPFEYQTPENPPLPPEQVYDSTEYNEGTDYSDTSSDATVEYPVVHTLYESEEDREYETEDAQELVTNMDANSVIIIQHENEGEQLIQEPNVVTVPENPTAGVENPIIRLENPDYEPETCKNTSSSEPVRGGGKRSYGTMISDDDDDDEGQTCPVCLDVWTNAGDHRLSALKCGHLFGKSCIVRWLSKEKKKYCPQCNKKAKPTDIRELYATKLTALDATEKTRLEKEIEVVKEQKKKLELELVRCNLNVENFKEQLEVMKCKLSKLLGDSDGSKKSMSKTNPKTVIRVIKFYLEKTFEVSEGSCRVCAYEPLTNMLVVSHQTRNQLFPGFGVRKIKKIGTDYCGNNFLYLHSKALRDLSFHPITPNLILTVSFDRCAKIADIKELNVLHTFKADYPLWSCCWDAEDPNVFYAGAGNGCVHVFDTRTPSSSAVCLNSSEDSSAVVSLRYAASKPPFKGGIICCRLNSVTLYEKTAPKEYNPITLHALVGPFFSLSYDSHTQHILASCRPSEEFTKVRHVYCELNGTECRKIHTFCGGTRQTLLSRSCFIRVNNETLVAVFQENTNSIDLWSTSTGCKIQSIPVSDQILDLTAIQLENRNLISTVSDSLVRFYEASSLKT